jgi:hypothetical protein
LTGRPRQPMMTTFVGAGCGNSPRVRVVAGGPSGPAPLVFGDDTPLTPADTPRMRRAIRYVQGCHTCQS